MKDEIRIPWTTELRAGNIGQTGNQLGRRSWNEETEKYDVEACCLGVLCLVHQDKLEAEDVEVRWVGSTLYVDGLYTSLSERVGSLLGIKGELGTIDPINLGDEEDPRNVDTLAELNDDTYYDFSDIADVIDDQLAEV
jgi:hypothetical protein